MKHNLSLYICVSLLAGLANGVDGCTAPPGGDAETLFNSNSLPSGQSLFDGHKMTALQYAPKPLQRVRVQWLAPAETRLEGRFLSRDGSFTSWLPVVRTWSEDLAHIGQLEPPHGSAVAVQLRLVSGPEPQSLVAEQDGIQKGEEGPIRVWSKDADDEVVSTHYFAQKIALPGFIKTRAEWDARAPIGAMSSQTPERITIHHTAGSNTPVVSPEVQLRQYQKDHQSKNPPWSDIGYHFLVDWYGQVWEGRELQYQGAHVEGYNQNNVGISFFGTYTNHEPTEEQLSSAAKLIRWLNHTFGVVLDASHIKGHRDYPGHTTNECPGDRLYAKIGLLIQKAKEVEPSEIDGTVDLKKGHIDGRVISKTTEGNVGAGSPVAGAKVNISGRSALFSDDQGEWETDLPAGSYEVEASASGYSSAKVGCMVYPKMSTPCVITLSKGGEDHSTTMNQNNDRPVLEGGCQYINPIDSEKSASLFWLFASVWVIFCFRKSFNASVEKLPRT